MGETDMTEAGTPAPSEEPLDPRTAMEDMVEFLTLGELGDGEWRGRAALSGEGYVFGGMVISQAVMAATRAVPTGTRLHSLHGYFLRPVSATLSTDYRIEDLRAGRSFTARRLTASQQGRAVLDMSFSLTADTDGYDFNLPATTPAPAPDSREAARGPGPWLAVWVGPTEARPDGSRESTHRAWYRIPFDLGPDIHLHTALVGFASDWTGSGGRPLQLEGDLQGMVSLDHAVWFHRPVRADNWLFFDVHSLVNAGGRGLLRGAVRDRAGRVVASVAQELRLTPPD
jgi:acyl-CoA thioesterase II